jgi:hypothetical protein
MAKQFQGSARSRGFGAATASGAAEQRIAQQTTQVVRGMERYRDSDIENRKRILKDMEENAAYTQRALERDKRTLSDNAGKEARAVEAEARASAAKSQANVDATVKAFEAVASISETAGKRAREVEQQRVDDEYWAGFNERRINGPNNPQQAAYDIGVAQEGIERAKIEGTISLAEAGGADPLAVSKARSATQWGSVGYEDANMLLTTQSSYEAYRNNALQSDDTIIQLADGSQFRVNEAKGDTSRTAAAMDYIRRQFITQEGWAGRSPQRLGKTLDFIQNSDNKYLTQEAAVETRRIESNMEQGALNILMTGQTKPIEANNAFITLMNTNKGDAEKTWTQLEGYVKKGLIPADALSGIIMPDNKTLGESPRYARFVQLETEAELAENSLRTKQENAQREKMSNEWMELLNSPEATMADMKAAEEAFKGDIKGTPQWLQKRINANDPQGQNITKSLTTRADDMAARKMLTLDLVNRVYEVDPVKGAQLREKLTEQNKFVNNDTYVEYRDSLEGLVKKSAETLDTVSSTGALMEITKQWNSRVEELTAGGMSIQDASRTSATEIEQKILAGMANPDSPYYRDWNATLGTYQYPNLVKTASLDQAGQEQSKAVLSAIASKPNDKIRELLMTKNSVFNDKEIEAIRVQYINDPANFKFPASVLKIADRLGDTPMTVLNRLIKTNQGDAGKLRLPPSQELLQTASPAARKLLDKYKSPSRSTRGLGMTSTGWNSGAIQPEYVPMIEKASAAAGVLPAETSALIDIESGFRPNQPSYNGSSLGMMQINRQWHPEFFANNNWRDPQANIEYGTQYYGQLKAQYGDPVAAAMAYNAGPVSYEAYKRGELPDGAVKREMLAHGKKFAKALYKYQGAGSGMLQSPDTMRDSTRIRSFTGALTYEDNKMAYSNIGKLIETSGFQVAEQSQFGGVSPVHAGNSYHNYDEAFDITHQTGDFETSIAKTQQLKEAIRSMNLFKEVIGPGDGDPNHTEHLHLGGLLRPMTPEDTATLQELLN